MEDPSIASKVGGSCQGLVDELDGYGSIRSKWKLCTGNCGGGSSKVGGGNNRARCNIGGR